MPNAQVTSDGEVCAEQRNREDGIGEGPDHRWCALADGWSLLLQTYDAGTNADEQLSAPDFTTPTAWDRVDGVISVAASARLDHLQRLKAAGIPVVLASNTCLLYTSPSPRDGLL